MIYMPGLYDWLNKPYLKKRMKTLNTIRPIENAATVECWYNPDLVLSIDLHIDRCNVKGREYTNTN
mgnify:CR=1 FL=1